MSLISITDVEENVRDGVYDVVIQKKLKRISEGHVFDEDKSVKWNREKVKSENEKVMAHNENIKESRAMGQMKFSEDLTEAISNETGLSSNQASVIYTKAWLDGHSSSYWLVLDIADELIDMVNEIKNMNV